MKKENIKLYRIKFSGEDIIGISYHNKKEGTFTLKYPMVMFTEYNESDKEDENKKVLMFKFWLNSDIVSQNMVIFLENELWELKLKEEFVELYLNMLLNISNNKEDYTDLVNISDEDKKDIQLLLENFNIINDQTIIH